MYSKKQIYFTIFIAIILLLTFYKQRTINRLKQNVTEVSVKIKEVDCRSLGRKNYSSFMFEFKGKSFKQGISKSKCLNISKGERFLLYYSPENNKFFLPVIMSTGYFENIIYFLIGILIIGLIPYKLLIK